MTNRPYKNYETSELRVMLETVRQEEGNVRREKSPGQTAEFWELVEDEQRILRELARRGVKPNPVEQGSLLEE